MRRIVAATLTLLLAAPGVAAGGGLAGAPFHLILPDTAPLLLAANAESPVTPLTAATSGEPAEDTFHTRLFTTSKLHMVLGLGSVAAGLMAAATAPDEDEGGGGTPDVSEHKRYGKLASQLGVAAVGTGLVFHWGDFSFRDGLLDPDILHLMLGTLGAAGFLYAVDTAPEETHTAVGPIAIVAMLVAIKVEW